MSKKRKLYFFRLLGRILIFILCLAAGLSKPQYYDVLDHMNFFKSFSPLHLLWFIWMFDMLLQIIPVKNNLALGSQKLFSNHFKPVREQINYQNLQRYIKSTTKSAYKILIIWTALTSIIGILYFHHIIDSFFLFMISVFFYVCDLICVLVWCPFRLIMKTKCCTTCRIFNWDHLIMFAPLIFMGGFFAISLVIFAFIDWLVWEISIMMYPERFSEATNASLKCSACTDKLCTQYCQKLR